MSQEINTIEIPQRNSRSFVPENFEIDTWETLLPFYDDLAQRNIGSKEELLKWFKDRSELESIISEDAGWRYIRMTCDTTSQEHLKSYQFFISELEPKIAPYSNELNKKVLESEFLNELDDEAYAILIRNTKKEFEIFREENIPLKKDIQTESQKFGSISGLMAVEVEGKEMTLQQAAVLLQSTDRETREDIYYKIANRRYQDKDKLDKLFTKLIKLRHRVARNADFDNFRDYMFKSLGRFDYTPQDCFNFHEVVAQEVVPILDTLALERKEKLNTPKLKPWDKAVDPTGKLALKPFKDSKELVKNTIECFRRLDPFLGDCISIMQEMGHLDLESRKGKAPGGYNYPLSEIGVPFIFMNATSTLRDLVTILHEGGHAVHSFVTRDLELIDFKHTPSEVAELASMSMELMTMEHWDLFFKEEDDLIRAKREHLEQIIETLPWVATIDKFQHWIYENPQHTQDQRTQNWLQIFETFSDSITDWKGQEKYRNFLWQKQLHLFEVPFYYIEYAIAQLGAVAIWKNFKEDPQQGLDGYLSALKLGYTRNIPQVYQAAHIQFDFSKDYIQDLIQFVRRELEKLI